MARIRKNYFAGHSQRKFRLSRNKHNNKYLREQAVSVILYSSALQSIRQHAHKSLNKDICGVLVGQKSKKETIVEGIVPAEGAAQGEMHVTFTQDAWVQIHRNKSKSYPHLSIVGWYHSHPGFGVFLSEHDLFIHKNFFDDPGQLALVNDPHSEEEGCFGWVDGEVQRIRRFEVIADTDRVKYRSPQVEAVVYQSQMLPSNPRKTLSRIFQRPWLILGAISILLIFIAVILMLALQSAPSSGNRTGRTAPKIIDGIRGGHHPLAGEAENLHQPERSDTTAEKSNESKEESAQSPRRGTANTKSHAGKNTDQNNDTEVKNE
ncbi:Mov34/MPN/PAD-1 family protein [candidate division KSB1 bacterium]|nr:Mov34/MPN/PAD-1 family protein [candidate division KSB1 bacterium]